MGFYNDYGGMLGNNSQPQIIAQKPKKRSDFVPSSTSGNTRSRQYQPILNEDELDRYVQNERVETPQNHNRVRRSKLYK